MADVVKVQDLMLKEIMEEHDDSQNNELLELMDFVQKNGVPLTDDQVRGALLLQEYGLSDIANYAIAIRPQLTPTKKIYTLINKLTLADRIKGNVKLGNLLKANMASPNNQIPASELQPKAMRASELR